MKSKLVKYEQRLKTNRERFIKKGFKKVEYVNNPYYMYLIESLYDELTKKTKLKIK